MWAILRMLFNFDMFSLRYWNLLLHAQLRGFGGFVFGILILAAIPMYAATTTIIVRTKKPLIEIKIPKFIRDLYAPTPEPETATPEAPDEEPADTTPAPTPAEEKSIPNEMRASFIRARHVMANTPQAPENTGTPSTAPDTYIPVATPVIAPASSAPAPTAPGDLPLPTDFDILDDAGNNTISMGDVPVFSEITFGDEPTESPTPATPETAAPENEYTTDVLKFMAENNRDATTVGDIVISGDIAVASHTDPEFWIADDTDWFAPGRMRPSPIAELINISGERNLKPILYLGTDNILDINARIEQWQGMGIRVVRQLSEIL